MSVTIADLLERNKATSETHTPIPTIDELREAGAPLPRTMVVTCMDPRCVPETFFNLNLGEVLVYRNAGGNIRYALRDLTNVDQLFGIHEIAIIHHTDCGTLKFTDEGVREGVKARVDPVYWPEVDKLVPGGNTDSSMVESVKADVEWVRAHPLIREDLKKATQGFVFDIKSGKVDKVV